jgi:hypothetical protein
MGKLFTERKGAESGWSFRSPVAAIFGERDEVEEKEEERKKD